MTIHTYVICKWSLQHCVYLCIDGIMNMRNAKSGTFTPTPDIPAQQFLEKVTAGSPADLGGLKKGDFLIEVS